jgi:hypothetical protein
LPFLNKNGFNISSLLGSNSPKIVCLGLKNIPGDIRLITPFFIRRSIDFAAV